MRWWACAFGVLAGIAGQAGAQDACVIDTPDPDDLQLTPAPGSSELVTVDSPVVARFPADVDVAEHEAERLLELVRVGPEGGESPVAGAYEGYGSQPNVLVFRPELALEAGTRYRGTARDPLDSTTRALSFEVGSRRDEEPPRFASQAGLSLRAASRAADCQGTRVDVAFRPALDDGPRGSVEHLVYQTRGAALSAPKLRGRVRASMGSEVSTSFVLGAEQAEEPLCVVVLPVDGVGRIGEPLGPACFAPDGGARFVGACAASRATGSAWWPACLWAVLAFGTLWRRLRGHGRT